MAKCKLWCTGGYQGMDDVKFPVEVECRVVYNSLGVAKCKVSTDELVRVGAVYSKFKGLDEWTFFAPNEAEIVE